MSRCAPASEAPDYRTMIAHLHPPLPGRIVLTAIPISEHGLETIGERHIYDRVPGETFFEFGGYPPTIRPVYGALSGLKVSKKM